MTNQSIESKIGGYLELQARKPQSQALVFYGALLESYDLPPFDGAWNAHPLSEIFGNLDLEDLRLNRPFRTSLVVNQRTCRPGNGFFEYSKQLGKYKGDLKDAISKDIYWGNEFENLLAYWKGKP